MQWAFTKQPSGTLERRLASQRRLMSWGETTPTVTFSPAPSTTCGPGELTAFYEVRTYSHDVLWFAKSQDALEVLVNQGKSVAALHEVRSRPSQVYQPEPEQHEQAVEEVGAALGYGVGHDPHRITPILSGSRSAPELPVPWAVRSLAARDGRQPSVP